MHLHFDWSKMFVPFLKLSLIGPRANRMLLIITQKSGRRKEKREGGGKGEGEEVESCTHSPLSGNDVDKGNAADSSLKHLPV